jgi:hypothetical protein
MNISTDAKLNQISIRNEKIKIKRKMKKTTFFSFLKWVKDLINFDKNQNLNEQIFKRYTQQQE